ncbi:hypothetical protein D3C85_1422660 [compost metagenome]
MSALTPSDFIRARFSRRSGSIHQDSIRAPVVRKAAVRAISRMTLNASLMDQASRSRSTTTGTWSLGLSMSRASRWVSMPRKRSAAWGDSRA